MHLGSLLPGPAVLGWSRVQVTQDGILIELRTTAPKSTCPSCGRASGRVHSRYTRPLGDFPWHGRPVRLLLVVRRFFCDYGHLPSAHLRGAYPPRGSRVRVQDPSARRCAVGCRLRLWRRGRCTLGTPAGHADQPGYLASTHPPRSWTDIA